METTTLAVTSPSVKTACYSSGVRTSTRYEPLRSVPSATQDSSRAVNELLGKKISVLFSQPCRRESDTFPARRGRQEFVPRKDIFAWMKNEGKKKRPWSGRTWRKTKEKISRKSRNENSSINFHLLLHFTHEESVPRTEQLSLSDCSAWLLRKLANKMSRKDNFPYFHWHHFQFSDDSENPQAPNMQCNLLNEITFLRGRFSPVVGSLTSHISRQHLGQEGKASKSIWVTDCVVLPNAKKIAVSSADREIGKTASREPNRWLSNRKWNVFQNIENIMTLTLSLLGVINVKFLLQPHQKYYITQ